MFHFKLTTIRICGIILSLFSVSLSLTGCLSAATAGASAANNRQSLESSVSNTVLAWQIEKQIKDDPQLKYETNINVTCINDIVLLTGQAPSELMREKAINYAKQTAGVNRVINQIQLQAPVSSYQKLNDSWITTKVKSNIIASGQLDADKVKIITENNTVYMLGSLPRAQAQAAIKIAQETDGVEKVVTAMYFLDSSTH